MLLCCVCVIVWFFGFDYCLGIMIWWLIIVNSVVAVRYVFIVC